MKTTRATIHMMLACYLSDTPVKSVKAIARKVKRTTTSARTRTTMRTILKCHDPVTLVSRVYNETF